MNLGHSASQLNLTLDGETGLPQVELGEVVTVDEVRGLTTED